MPIKEICWRPGGHALPDSHLVAPTLGPIQNKNGQFIVQSDPFRQSICITLRMTHHGPLLRPEPRAARTSGGFTGGAKAVKQLVT